ncbi:hypothetical protein FRX31_020324 [Thalictrum thalictroides]|uniref:SUPPRESSOR-OF-WHITE-APRICOT-like C-terminal domain-containing protein n=1 Tax=Thalictrum thalictroides TaxID=46969 RepID=A0A7J6VY89_THATH|nr:hypothetical protein FRX31_020324 [Thalictrum thalictroides]
MSKKKKNLEVPPYPVFPHGLVPDMVTKMLIGTGVLYSPIDPFGYSHCVHHHHLIDHIPFRCFRKTFKEVNPSEGPLKSPNSSDDDNDYEREGIAFSTSNLAVGSRIRD